MNLHLPLPMFVLRRIVRKHPWLLADRGVVSRSQTITLVFFGMEIETAAELTPRQKARLQADADAGTLFR
jgi:hypothetical protein